MRERSFFLSIVGLFLVLSFSLTILSTALLMGRTRRIIESTFAERGLDGIAQVSHMFDVLHAQIIPGLKQAGYNNHQVARLMYESDLERLEILRGIKYLDNLLLAYPLLHSLYIYNGQMDIFLTTSSGLEDADDFYDRDVLNLLNTLDFTLIDRYRPRIGTTLYPPTMEQSSFETLTLLIGSAPGDNTVMKGALISNISVAELEKVLRPRSVNTESDMFIFNREGEFIAGSRTGNEEERHRLFEEMLQSADNTERDSRVVNNQYLMSYQFNYRLGWYLISAMPMDELNRSLINAGRWNLLVVTLLLLIGFVLSYLAARRLYKPIDRLVHYVSEEIDESESPGNGNREIRFITHRYRRILDEKEALEASLKSLRGDHRIEIFRAILDDDGYSFWEEEMAGRETALFSRPITLFVVQIDDYQRLTRELNHDDFHVKRGIIVKLTREAAEKEAGVFIEKAGKNTVCILPVTARRQQTWISSLQHRVLQESGITISIGYDSRNHWREKQLHILFRRALIAVNGKFSAGFSYAAPYSGGERAPVIFPDDTADRLFREIRQGNLPGADVQLERIRDSVKYGTYQDFLQYIRTLSDRILKFIGSLELPDIETSVRRLRSQPETLETLDDFYRVFGRVIRGIHSAAGQPEGKPVLHFREINAALAGSFTNPACCVQLLADTLNLSVNYIRQIYKDFSGKSLSDEINRLRVEEACRLLRESDDAIKDIYSRAGFTSYNSFFPMFKKLRGETPAVYRTRSAITGVIGKTRS